MRPTPNPPIIVFTSPQLSLMLRSLRKSKGWSQTDLAERLNISQQAVSKIEVDASNLSWERLHHILNILEAKVSIVTNEYLAATQPKTEW